MITYTEVPSLSVVMLDSNIIPTPPLIDINGGQVLLQFTAPQDGTYALDMTLYCQCGGVYQDVTTLLTLNSNVQSLNPNFNSRTTQPNAQELTHTHKAKIVLLIGDVVYFAGFTSGVGGFTSNLINGAMIVQKL
jgi:hypothetical protein